VTGLAILARLGAHSSIGAVMIGLACVGVGVGVFQVANLSEMMAAFPRARQGVAGGLAFLGRTLGSAVGVQISAQVFDARVSSGLATAFQWAFGVAAMVAALGVLIAVAPAVRARDGRPAAV
jgi:dipeptide/tripeptide permease